MVFSSSGEFLPIALRLRREGTDCSIYLHLPQYRKNYRGILKTLGLKDLRKEVRKADIIIADIVRPNERKKCDIALLKSFGCKLSNQTVYGPILDKLAKDHKVIGASAITDDLELGRYKGIELAEKMGFAIPEMHTFKRLKDGAKFLEGRKDLWVFKPENNQDIDLTYMEKFAGELFTKILEEYTIRIGDKCDFLLQKKIDGAEVSTEVWVAGGPIHFNQTIENKRLMDGDLGLAIGSQSNTVWLKKDAGITIGPLTKMANYLKSNGYRGPCDANCIIKGGLPYFLEWSPRFGWDALYCLLTLVKGRFTDFFVNDFKVDFYEGFGVSERLSIPPYPYGISELRTMYAKDVSIIGKLEDYPKMWFQDVYSDAGKLKCAGADGIISVCTARGETLEEAWGRVYNAINKVKVCSYVQHRTDGLAQAKKRIERLKVA